jgi:hypothetical protein
VAVDDILDYFVALLPSYQQGRLLRLDDCVDAFAEDPGTEFVPGLLLKQGDARFLWHPTVPVVLRLFEPSALLEPLVR